MQVWCYKGSLTKEKAKKSTFINRILQSAVLLFETRLKPFDYTQTCYNISITKPEAIIDVSIKKRAINNEKIFNSLYSLPTEI